MHRQFIMVTAGLFIGPIRCATPVSEGGEGVPDFFALVPEELHPSPARWARTGSAAAGDSLPEPAERKPVLPLSARQLRAARFSHLSVDVLQALDHRAYTRRTAIVERVVPENPTLTIRELVNIVNRLCEADEIEIPDASVLYSQIGRVRLALRRAAAAAATSSTTQGP